MADEWQLVMWQITVAAFYYGVRIAIGDATDADRSSFAKHRQAISEYRAYGLRLAAFPGVPPDDQPEELIKIAGLLQGVVDLLRTNTRPSEPA